MNRTINGVACALVGIAALPVWATTPSALVREGDALSIGTVTSISNTAVNQAGGFGVTLNADDGTDTLSAVFGAATGTVGSILVSEGTYGDFQQTSYESFFGVDDAGIPVYSPSTTRISTGTTGLDAVWQGTTPVQTEEDAVADAPGEFSSFNSRPGVTAGGTPYWVGGLTDSVGGPSLDRGLFYDGNILLRGNDNIGVPEPVTFGGGIDFDFRFSANGTNYISPIDVQSSSSIDLVMVVNGTAISPGGSLMREGTQVPMSLGGDGVENWDNFDFVGINEAGDYFVTGDTDGDTSKDEFVSMNGSMILREGELVGGFTLSGSIESGFMNEDGDWAVIWDVDTPGGNVEALIINGHLILMEGDPVDWNGDGTIDPMDSGRTIDQFTGLSSMTLSGRDASGNVRAFFTADTTDANGSVLEGAFHVAYTVPEPATGGLWAALLVGFAALRRRA